MFEVGQEVIVYNNSLPLGGEYLGVVISCTKSFCEVKGGPSPGFINKFRRKNGTCVNSDNYYSIREASPGKIEIIKLSIKRNNFETFLKRFDYSKLGIEEMRSIYNIIKEFEKREPQKKDLEKKEYENK